MPRQRQNPKVQKTGRASVPSPDRFDTPEESSAESTDVRMSDEDEEDDEPPRALTRKRKPVTPPATNPPPAKRKRGRPKKSDQPSQPIPSADAAEDDEDDEDDEPKAKANLAKEKARHKTVSRMRASFKARFPLIKERSLLRDVVPKHPTFDDEWTEADEQRLSYRGSQMERELKDLHAKCNGEKKNSVHSDLMALWKACIRVYRVSPLYLLSPVRGLDHLPVSPGRGPQTIVWGQNVAHSLVRIIVHPIFNGDLQLLTAVLQYAVICRTDDRRHWDLPITELDGGPLERFKSDLEASRAPLPTSVHEMHIRARGARRSRAYCPISDLMIKIGDVVKEKKGSKQASRFAAESKFYYENLPVRSVTIVDLGNITQAINELFRVGGTSHKDVDAAFVDYKTSLHTNADLPDKSRLAELYERAWLHEQRRLVRAVRPIGQQPIEVESDVESDVESRIEDEVRDEVQDEVQDEVNHRYQARRRRVPFEVQIPRTRVSWLDSFRSFDDEVGVEAPQAGQGLGSDGGLDEGSVRPTESSESPIGLAGLGDDWLSGGYDPGSPGDYDEHQTQADTADNEHEVVPREEPSLLPTFSESGDDDEMRAVEDGSEHQEVSHGEPGLLPELDESSDDEDVRASANEEESDFDIDWYADLSISFVPPPPPGPPPRSPTPPPPPPGPPPRSPTPRIGHPQELSRPSSSLRALTAPPPSPAESAPLIHEGTGCRMIDVGAIEGDAAPDIPPLSGLGWAIRPFWPSARMHPNGHRTRANPTGMTDKLFKAVERTMDM